MRSPRSLRPYALGLPLALLIGLIAWSVTRAPAPPATGSAIEYYHAALDQYQLAIDPEEAAGFDAAAGWARTGGEFTVARESGPGLAAVCRFRHRAAGSGARFHTADAAECARLKDSPEWTYDSIAFYVPAPGVATCGRDAYPVLRSHRTSGQPEPAYRYTTDVTAHARMSRQGFVSDGVVMCSPRSQADLDADIVRLLEQATLGPTETLVSEVKARGIERWLDEQVAQNVTRYTQYSFFVPPDDPAECIDDATPPVAPEKYCHTYNIAPWPVGWEFYRQSKTAPDQVRLRMAHAWHQIFVVSDGPGTYAYAAFHQTLRDHVFGTFEELLLKYALSPFLGEYQNWLFNVPEHDGVRPNENFARELMQLFTIGVTELNEDGTPRLDAAGVPVPTYGQGDIETLARVLTGFGFPPRPGKEPEWQGTRYYIGDMVAFEAYHDRGPKRLLGGRIDLPAGGTALAEVRAAVHALVGHPNTPPFISKQLIQKLVTSDPTPAYVARVSAVFKDNGQGVRGDLAAVTRAVLLDPEARGARKIDPQYGRLREPALFWTAMIRGLDVTTDGVIPYEEVARSSQFLFLPPSVFNYYSSDHTLGGGAIPAPEFAIYGSSEFLNRSNQLVMLLYDADLPVLQFHYGPRPYVKDALGTPTPSLSAFLPDAGDANRLVARIDRLFLHGTMRPAQRRTIVNAVDKIPVTEPLARTRMALRLTLSSIDYHVQK